MWGSYIKSLLYKWDIPIVVEAELIVPADYPLYHLLTISITVSTKYCKCIEALGLPSI